MARQRRGGRGRSAGVGREFALYPSNTTLGWSVSRYVSFDKGESKVAMGVWRRVNDQMGNHIGYQMIASAVARGDLDLASRPQPVSITMKQMELNAAASRTMGMGEEQRMERVACGLAPEDEIERVQMKVAVWPLLGSGKGDIRRAWDAAMATAAI